MQGKGYAADFSIYEYFTASDGWDQRESNGKETKWIIRKEKMGMDGMQGHEAELGTEADAGRPLTW
jgi:hypothetical protein